MKKKILYALTALIITITTVLLSIYLYKKYTVELSPLSFENLEFETLDFLPYRPALEQTDPDAPEK